MTDTKKARMDLDKVDLIGAIGTRSENDVHTLFHECRSLRTENARLRAMAEADAFEMGRVKEENIRLEAELEEAEAVILENSNPVPGGFAYVYDKGLFPTRCEPALHRAYARAAHEGKGEG